MAPKCIEDGPRWLQDGPKWPKRPSREPKRPPRGSPGGPKEAKIIVFPEVSEGCWHLLLLGIPTAEDGPRGSQDRPKIAHKASKMAP
eukprot:1264581-Pyramimonas_sp.AAC.1